MRPTAWKRGKMRKINIISHFDSYHDYHIRMTMKALYFKFSFLARYIMPGYFYALINYYITIY